MAQKEEIRRQEAIADAHRLAELDAEVDREEAAKRAVIDHFERSQSNLVGIETSMPQCSSSGLLAASAVPAVPPTKSLTCSQSSAVVLSDVKPAEELSYHNVADNIESLRHSELEKEYERQIAASNTKPATESSFWVVRLTELNLLPRLSHCVQPGMTPSAKENMASKKRKRHAVCAVGEREHTLT